MSEQYKQFQHKSSTYQY